MHLHIRCCSAYLPPRGRFHWLRPRGQPSLGIRSSYFICQYSYLPFLKGLSSTRRFGITTKGGETTVLCRCCGALFDRELHVLGDLGSVLLLPSRRLRAISWRHYIICRSAFSIFLFLPCFCNCVWYWSPYRTRMPTHGTSGQRFRGSILVCGAGFNG